jgi:hypothetical protein
MKQRSSCFFALFALIAAFTLAAAKSATAQADGFTPGDLVVYRVGDGTTNLANTGNPVFVDEYNPTGTLVQSLEMPTTANGNQNAFFAGGTATSEGGLTVSPNGKYIALTGYGGMSTSPTSLPNSSLPRVVGIINTSTGAIDTSTAPSDFAIGNNPRSAVTTDGVSIWTAGGSGGVSYTTIGNTGASTQISPSPSNSRQINIFGGQLYVSSSAGGQALLGSLGAGLPTTSGQSANPIPGFPTISDAAHLNPYSYFFADLNPAVPGVDTLYVADDTTHQAPTPAGGITKYSLVDGSWVSDGSIDETSSNYRGLTGVVENGQVTLYSTRGASGNSANGLQIVTLTDSSGYSGAFTGTPTVLATAGTNEAFRGIGVINVTGLAGDLNLDGHVDSADIQAMENALSNLNKFQFDNSLSSSSLLSIADVNGDGQVNNADLQALLSKLINGGGNLTSVPEPAGIELAGLGLLGLIIAAGFKPRKS